MGYQLLPPLATDEYAALRKDISSNGVLVPIITTDKGEIVDGHHRAKIARELGVPCPEDVKTGYTESEYRDMALRVNVHRRNLTREQRAELHAKLRADGMSYREIAATTGVAVNTVQRDTEGVLESTPRTVTGKDGKTYPATKPVAKVETTQSVKTTEYVDTETGELSTDGPESDPMPTPLARSPRTDVISVIGSVMNRAEDAARAADRLSVEHFRNRQEQAAKWHRDLSPYVQSLTRLLDALERAST